MTRHVTVGNTFRNTRYHLGSRTLLISALFLPVAGAATAQSVVPLYTWYSDARGDYFTTSDPSWAGEHGEVRAGQGNYWCLGIEGHVFSPEDERPAGTVPLYSWWSRSRKDNFLTSDPNWAGEVGDRRAGQGDYRLFRIEGYIPARPVAGTLALRSFWSRNRRDNAATAMPDWRAAADPQRGDYVRYRTEGYVFASYTTHHSKANDRLLRDRYGLGRLPTPEATPLLVVALDYPDTRFSDASPLNKFRRMFATDRWPNLTSYISQASANKFRWAPIEIVGVVTSARSLAGAIGAGGGWRRREVLQLARAAGIDFSDYDNNPPDGVIRSNELAVVRFSPGENPVGGQNGRPAPFTAEGVDVQASVNLVGEDVPLTNVGHEGLHAFGAEDIYGPRRAFNFRLSLMGANLGANQNGFYLPDPWHRMQLEWGWTNARVSFIFDDEPGQFVRLPNAATTHYDSPAAVLLADPSTRPNEFFMLEFRRGCGSGWTEEACNRYADNAVADDGLAIWHILTDSDRSLRRITRNMDAAGVVAWFPGSQPQEVQGALLVGAPNRSLGQGSLWRQSDGEISLRWFDGTDTGVRIRVGYMSDASLEVEWALADVGFIPSILKVAPPNVRRGGRLVLDGVFGLRGSRTVNLRRGGVVLDLAVETWSSERVSVRLPHFTAVRGPGPRPLPTGTYELRVYADARRTLASDALTVEVVP
jgi:hypothetical protein